MKCLFAREARSMDCLLRAEPEYFHQRSQANAVSHGPTKDVSYLALLHRAVAGFEKGF